MNHPQPKSHIPSTPEEEEKARGLEGLERVRASYYDAQEALDPELGRTPDEKFEEYLTKQTRQIETGEPPSCLQRSAEEWAALESAEQDDSARGEQERKDGAAELQRYAALGFNIVVLAKAAVAGAASVLVLWLAFSLIESVVQPSSPSGKRYLTGLLLIGAWTAGPFLLMYFFRKLFSGRSDDAHDDNDSDTIDSQRSNRRPTVRQHPRAAINPEVPSLRPTPEATAHVSAPESPETGTRYQLAPSPTPKPVSQRDSITATFPRPIRYEVSSPDTDPEYFTELNDAKQAALQLLPAEVTIYDLTTDEIVYSDLNSE